MSRVISQDFAGRDAKKTASSSACGLENRVIIASGDKLQVEDGSQETPIDSFL